ncbi:MAG: PhoPQ-activated pathogenicity-related family protein [Planctomycetota bacterium]|jgi:PhoPQ-activated pathogenicity-related protein
MAALILHRRRFVLGGLMFAMLLAGFSRHSHAQLKRYVEKPDKAFEWRHVKTVPLGSGKAHVLHLTSQRWQNTVWRHRLVVVQPEKVSHPEFAALVIGGGSNKKSSFEKMPSELPLLGTLATKSGSVIATLGQVPNQPLFNGLHEDALIAYTFQKFLEERKADWPLLLPMTKSAVRAMDAVQAFLAEKHDQKVKKFFVTGASKRGWTTWLTGAVDSRVAAIAPMVIDVLNIPRQMRHQLASWGKYSEMIHDYSDRGLLDLLTGARAKPLLQMVDPYLHREALRMPKLVFIGTNDRYWPVDAARFYLFDMVGETYLHYVPNAGHGLDLSILGTLTGFYQEIIGGRERPRFTWAFECIGRSVHLHIVPKRTPETVGLWTATSKTRDFREVKWTRTAVEPDRKNVYTKRVEMPGEGEGSIALYAALTFKSATGEAYTLCTNVRVFPVLRTK